MELNLAHVPPAYGSEAGAIGYSRYGVQLHRALENLGVQVYGQPDTPDGKICNTVCWVSVPTHVRGWWENQFRIISTMWETMYLPAPFRDNLHHFDAIVVPCEHNVEVFGNYHSNVVKIPLGIDPECWHYTPRQESDFFTFFCGGSGERKGVDLAVAAFKKTFGDWKGSGRVPRLMLKNPKSEESVKDVDLWGPNIFMVSGRLTDEEEIDLYGHADCYVQPSRGEGFGLQPLQAMAQGIPTILTDASGQAEFAHLGYGISAVPTPASYFIYGDCGNWWEPNLDELCDHMRWVYEHQDLAVDAAKKSAEIVSERFTWNETARKFCEAFAEPLSVSYQGSRKWVEPELKRYLVVVNRHLTANISGTQYRFVPGRDYWEVADIKRVLFESGALEPSCFDVPVGSEIDCGLTLDQVAKIPDYSGSMSFCPTCLQRLNSEPTRGDLIYAET